MYKNVPFLYMHIQHIYNNFQCPTHVLQIEPFVKAQQSVALSHNTTRQANTFLHHTPSFYDSMIQHAVLLT